LRVAPPVVVLVEGTVVTATVVEELEVVLVDVDEVVLPVVLFASIIVESVVEEVVLVVL
jgi:hypothetical protein